MEKYAELELLLNKAKGGDENALLALQEVMKQLDQLQEGI